MFCSNGVPCLMTTVESKTSMDPTGCLATVVSVTLVNFAQLLLDTKLEISALKDHKMTLKGTKSKVPHTCSTSTPQVPNFGECFVPVGSHV